MAKKIESKFEIFKANNGWLLYIPKDDNPMKDASGMMGEIMGKMGYGDTILDKAKQAGQGKSEPTGSFMFPSLKEMFGFINLHFEEVEVQETK